VVGITESMAATMIAQATIGTYLVLRFEVPARIITWMHI
jgi:hypothetical protein